MITIHHDILGPVEITASARADHSNQQRGITDWAVEKDFQALEEARSIHYDINIPSLVDGIMINGKHYPKMRFYGYAHQNYICTDTGWKNELTEKASKWVTENITRWLTEQVKAHREQLHAEARDEMIQHIHTIIKISRDRIDAAEKRLEQMKGAN